MDVLRLGVSDRILEMGNYFFSVQNVEYSGEYDLEYENSNSEKINKLFNETDYEINRFILTIILFFKGIALTPVSLKANDSKRITHNAVNKSNGSTYLFHKQSASQTIRTNVRNRLLNTINEDMENYRTNAKTKSTKKHKIKSKNQFINDLNRLDESDVGKDKLNMLFEYIKKIFHNK